MKLEVSVRTRCVRRESALNLNYGEENDSQKGAAIKVASMGRANRSLVGEAAADESEVRQAELFPRDWERFDAMWR